jgi:hypothetical protein
METKDQAVEAQQTFFRITDNIRKRRGTGLRSARLASRRCSS